jgi:hypothetical protein
MFSYCQWSACDRVPVGAATAVPEPRAMIACATNVTLCANPGMLAQSGNRSFSLAIKWESAMRIIHEASGWVTKSDATPVNHGRVRVVDARIGCATVAARDNVAADDMGYRGFGRLC